MVQLRVQIHQTLFRLAMRFISGLSFIFKEKCMRIKWILLVSVTWIAISQGSVAQDAKHLFILSGQSNMVGLKPEESFLPTLDSAFGKGKVIVVKDALGSQPIRRWYKDWLPMQGNTPTAQADLYDSLMKKVNAAISKQHFESVTFIWMQGERDAREQLGEVYEKSLLGLYHQLSGDLNRKDVNFIVGRLSDYDMTNEKYPHWTMIREIQTKVGSSNPRFAWVNTDDLNDGFDRSGKAIQNDLHMSADGYVILGYRFAQQAIRLINSHKP
jgi:Carbohydrate esterase, sialic acid-specific acetylesterase